MAESLCTSDVQVSDFQPSCVTQGTSTAICPSFLGSNFRDLHININESQGSPISKDGSNRSDADSFLGLQSQSEIIPPHTDNRVPHCQQKLKETFRKKFSHLQEGLSAEGSRTPLDSIYTELYITQGKSSGVNREHEVRQIELASQPDSSEKSVHCSQLFLPDENSHIRTVVTRGVAGIGKTVSVSKFTLDWAEGRQNGHLDFVFPLSFRDLNLMEKRKLSLVNLLNTFFPETKDLALFKGSHKMLFILDGLDESRLQLDFSNDHILSDIFQEDGVTVLLTNLIRGRLLPSALVWITTRPSAFSQIPMDCIHLVTEVRGFNNDQKDEYFRRKIADRIVADKVITHVKACRSLYIMCHIPDFCWMVAKVLERELKAEDNRDAMPKTLTQIYIHFLFLYVDDSRKRLSGQRELNTECLRENLMSLGELAFGKLLKGQLVFNEKDLAQSGVKISQDSVFSGVYTQIFSEEISLFQEKVFCFVHLSIQEFFAALYVFLKFHNDNYNVLIRKSSASRCFPFRDSSELILYKAAVDKALQSQNRHLDLFLRFLLGLSLKTNYVLLKHLMTSDRTKQRTRGEIIEHIKQKIRAHSSPDTCLNLFHCLSELNDCSLVDEIQSLLKSGSLEQVRLSPAQWASLVFVLLTSKEDLSVFQVSHYSRSEEALLWLLPVVKMARVANLAECRLTVKSCEVLASAVASSRLAELNLHGNDLTDKGMPWLSWGLKRSKIHTLSLRGCNLTHECCDVLASVISISTLKSLDLSDNDFQDLGLEKLCRGLHSPPSGLEKLSLSLCRLTEQSCPFLASALSSSVIRELDLSYNHLGKLGMQLLSALVEEPSHHLQKLSMDHCDESRLQPAPRKYIRALTLEPNSAHCSLILSTDSRRATRSIVQPLSDHPDRFEFWSQVLCSEGLTGRCYWEAEWSGRVFVGVAYRGMSRKGEGHDSWLGKNTSSWGVSCSVGGYQAWHNDTGSDVPTAPGSKRVGVFLDWSAGTLSFFMAASGTLTLLHTFHTTFTEPLFPGFRLGWVESTVFLC